MGKLQIPMFRCFEIRLDPSPPCRSTLDQPTRAGIKDLGNESPLVSLVGMTQDALRGSLLSAATNVRHCGLTITIKHMRPLQDDSAEVALGSRSEASVLYIVERYRSPPFHDFPFQVVQAGYSNRPRS
jgi:hypothetical protein